MRLKLLTLSLLVALSACNKKADTPAQLTQPVASIQEIMQSIVDPSADELWDAASTTVTVSGTEEHRPKTDEDWLKLRHLAVALAEAPNLLTQAGRRVAHEGKTLEDAHIKGILTADEIQKKIDADPALFKAKAHALQAAAIKALAAIDAKNVDQLIETGAKLDHACESCHKTYWYPNDTLPVYKP